MRMLQKKNFVADTSNLTFLPTTQQNALNGKKNKQLLRRKENAKKP